MFGPNTHLKTQIEVCESHRDYSSHTLIKTVRDEIQHKFQLFDYELLFLLGGGSLGVESLIYSSRVPVDILGIDGLFTTRWKKLASIHNQKKLNQPGESRLSLYCQIETSLSAQQFFCGGAVDAVSSFPYLAIPQDTPAFVTSSNKVLGSMVGLTIVGIARDKIRQLIADEDESYLSLAKYLRYIANNQTPSTTSIHNLRHLLWTVRALDIGALRKRIDAVSDLIVSTIGEINIVGSKRGPVITIREESIPKTLVDKWELYRKPTMGGVVHIFTYSCSVSAYEAFCNEYEATT